MRSSRRFAAPRRAVYLCHGQLPHGLRAVSFGETSLSTSVMNTEELRAIQAPLKEHYKTDPHAAVITLAAQGRLGEGLTCNVQTARALTAAGLHPATGGTGLHA